jgi:hypothetical protein
LLAVYDAAPRRATAVSVGAPLEKDVEILRRAGLHVKTERMTPDDDVLNPFAGELLQL